MAAKESSGDQDARPELGGGVYGNTNYESDRMVAEYLAFHYPATDDFISLLGEGAPGIEERYPYAVRGFWTPVPGADALDVGTATGRVTSDLARDHGHAFGLDTSVSFIRAAVAVQSLGAARYTVVVEGDLEEAVEVPVEPFPNASFLVGDALHLPFESGRFATVTGLNLLCRVPDPKRALAELARVTRPGGTLVIASPYTWVDSFTPSANWLGGYSRNRQPVRASDEIRERLAPAFELQRDAMLPFFIRHHARSGQLGLSHVQSFRRVS